MHLIKLDATDSTNAYLKRLLRSQETEDYTVITAQRQSQGRGQMGTIWESDIGKNLTFSVLKKNIGLTADKGFVLNVCVSMAIYEVLQKFQVPELAVKWPNDILSGTAKLCGILIENNLLGNQINTSVIGIGLNVNQTSFENLPRVSSLKMLLGGTFNLDGLLEEIVKRMKIIFAAFEENGSATLWDAYEKALFRKGVVATFEKKNGDVFKGIIEGVSNSGKLVVSSEDGKKEKFGLKEVSLHY